MFLKARTKLHEFIKLSRLAGPVGAVKYVLPNCRISCDVPGLDRKVLIRSRSSDYITYRQIFVQRHYEHARIHPTPSCIVDLGANIGLASIYLHEQYPNAKIYAVEADCDNFKMLESNTRDIANVERLNAAISCQDGTAALLNPNEQKHGLRFAVETNGTGGVCALSMQSLISKFELGTIDILKIDIEGSEVELFETNHRWLNQVNNILIETHDTVVPSATSRVLDVAKGFGFTVKPAGEGFHLFRPSPVK